MNRPLQSLALCAAVAFVASACGTPEAKPGDDDNNGVIVITSDGGNGTESGDAGVPDAGNEPLTVEPGAVTIAAGDAVEIGSSGGNVKVVVSVEIANGFEEAIPVSFNLFRLRVDQLERLPSQDFGHVTGVCPADSLLSSGMVLGCVVLFEFPEGSEPTALIFQSPQGAVESPLSFQPCTRCDGACVDLDNDSLNCGQCGRTIPTGGTCEAGEPTCPEGRYDCQGYCDSNTTECYVNQNARQSCASVCEREGLRCTAATYYYRCTDVVIDAHPDLGCDDVPPTSWDECGPFDSVDCRCLP